jgi:predicted Zn-dependent protease
MSRSPVAPAVLAAMLAVIGAGSAAAFEPLTPSLAARHRPAADATEAGLWMVSDQAEDATRTSPRRIHDAMLETYLYEIICRLAKTYCDDIRVYVVRVPQFNATMMPNGAMQIWSGLLIRVHNEAQLASVLGHEIGHYLRRHSLDRFRDIKNKTALLTVLSLGLGGAVAALRALTQADYALFIFIRDSYSSVAQAGYDPAEAHRVWKNILDEDAASVDPKKPRLLFLSTHPSPEGRLETLTEYAAELGGAQTMTATEARAHYFEAVGDHLRTFFEDELRLNQPGRSEYIFKQSLAAGFAPGLVNYYLGEVERMRDTATQSEAALTYYETALAHPDAPPEAHRAIGLWRLKARQMVEARSYLERYLALAPHAADREMIEYYLTLTGDTP